MHYYRMAAAFPLRRLAREQSLAIGRLRQTEANEETVTQFDTVLISATQWTALIIQLGKQYPGKKLSGGRSPPPQRRHIAKFEETTMPPAV